MGLPETNVLRTGRLGGNFEIQNSKREYHQNFLNLILRSAAIVRFEKLKSITIKNIRKTMCPPISKV